MGLGAVEVQEVSERAGRSRGGAGTGAGAPGVQEVREEGGTRGGEGNGAGALGVQEVSEWEGGTRGGEGSGAGRGAGRNVRGPVGQRGREGLGAGRGPGPWALRVREVRTE